MVLLIALGGASSAFAQSKPATANTPEALQQQIRSLDERLRFMEESLAKSVDDLMWYRKLDDIAHVDKVAYTGPPPRVIPNPAGQGARNPVIINAYTFLPKNRPGEQKLPLVVFVHGGVHGDFGTANAHIVRELVAQGYAVIAPEYRGSRGYGRNFWQLIDYGGLENDDVLAGKRWMLEHYPNLDPERVGIIGWSHGGMIALMNIFFHPGDYKVAYAGVPVSDVILRLGYKSQNYRELFSASYHIGKTPEEDVAEYRRRSPVFHAEKLKTPLMIHTTTNDEDVNVMEVEALIKALKAAGKQFESKIYRDAPGGHAFNRIDTTLARESRQEIYRFLARYLSPPDPPRAPLPLGSASTPAQGQ
ncbi:alpha/beta hydrolase family protein [Gloeobacter morelensis]|uniref:S9 family peptidase n=1 Tax=Gloeobacter morelensis MG652769 TaxID=2781736 RepID=A0ABY3PRZ4_9CYAN|nr:alpha/beta fold hydrolase [Gloeobacter morelensis]UFP96217.1 S9 family peptidase [Gloeobacter morelensis MG652769]